MLTLPADASSFLALTQADLAQNEVANGLLLGIALGAQSRSDSRPPFWATVQDDEGLAAAALMTPPFPLVVYAARPDPAPAFAAIAGALLDQGWSTPGVNGPVPASAHFAAVWSRLTGQPHAIAVKLRVFELRKVTPPRGAPGVLRWATLADRTLVEQWMDAFVAEATPEHAGNRDPNAAQRAIEQGRIALWQDGDRTVSIAAQARQLLHGATVNLVYTPPALRGRGYASACVAALSQHLLDSGWEYCTLFTDLANPISNSIYQKIGYRPVCDYVQYRFGE